MKQSNFTNNYTNSNPANISAKRTGDREQMTGDYRQLQKLISGCLQKNKKDQKVLYKTFYGFAMNICLRYACNRCEAVEIMNQGFLNVFTNLNSYDTARPFIPWLGGIMINMAIDYYKSNLKLSINECPDTVECIGRINLTDREFNCDELVGMLQRLPTGYRTVFNLFAIEGFSHEEIATQLNICTDTSKMTMFKAREKLKIMILNSGRLRDNSF